MKERIFISFHLCQCFYNTLPKCLSKNSNILIDITIIKQAKKKKTSKKINIGNLEMLEGFTNL